MGSNKKYSGYKSFQYLEPHVDYVAPPMQKQVGRIPPYDFGLSKTQEEHVWEIIKKNKIISIHEHLRVDPENGYKGPPVRGGRRFIAYESLAHVGFDCVFNGIGGGFSFEEVVRNLGMVQCDFYHQDFVVPCLKAADVETAFANGNCAILSMIERADAVAPDVDRIDVLYGLGLRSIGICYNESNHLGGGLGEIKDAGLTDFGYDAVVRMNKLGVLIDVSHSGDVTCMDTIEASKDPICISHRGSRTLTPAFSTRMSPDEVLKACAEKNGVVGIEVAGFGLRTKKHPESSIEGFMEQMEYCIDMLGVDHVAPGPDTMYIDHVAMYRDEEKMRRMGGSGHHDRPRPKGVKDHYEERLGLIEGLDYVKGLESPSDFPNIIRGLIRDGYSDAEIVKVVGGNAVRLLKQVL